MLEPPKAKSPATAEPAGGRTRLDKGPEEPAGKLMEAAPGAEQVRARSETLNLAAAERRGPEPVQPRANRTGLPDRLRAGVERLSGLRMDDVRVHYGSSRPARLGAHAFAEGSDIYLGPGQAQHLPHEAWHVVQQKQGRVRPTKQLKGVAVNDCPDLEGEADRFGARALGEGHREADAAGRTASAPADVVQRKMPAGWNEAAWIAGLPNKPADDAERAMLVKAIQVWKGAPGPLDPTDYIGLLAALLAADAPVTMRRAVGFWLGLLEGGKNHSASIGTLAVDERGGKKLIKGRPSLFGIAPGTPTQARRHIVAWHTLRAIINAAVETFGSVKSVYRKLSEVAKGEEALKAIGEKASKIAGEVGKNDEEKEVLWVGTFLNNLPHNLWLGSASENIAINTMAMHLGNWSALLEEGAMTIDEFAKRVENYKARAGMPLRAKTEIFESIGKLKAARKATTEAVITLVDQAIFGLAVDPEQGAEANTVQNLMFVLQKEAADFREAEFVAALAEFVKPKVEMADD